MSWRNWLQRLAGGPASPAPPASPAAAARGTSTPAAVGGPGQPAAAAKASGVPAAAGAMAQAADAAYGSQQPLVDPRGRIAGFECLLPPAVAQRLAARGDTAAQVAHHALLMAAMQAALARGRQAVAELPAALLARAPVADAVPAQAWLCVPDLHLLPETVARTLRGRGARLGVPDGPPASAPQADFVWLRAAGDVDMLLLSAQRWQEARPRLPRIASGLETVDDIERLLGSGFALVGGRLDRRRTATDKPLNAAAHRICELMNHLALNRDTALVADAVRADVALSYRLLRYANSPALALSRAVESVEQAVLLLGRQELARWLSLLLLSAASSRQAAAALQEQALARGRLLEQLGRAAGEEAPDALFSLGMFSMLEPLLEMPLAQALGPLRLGEATRAALLEASGPWAPYLQLAQALEREDSEQAETLGAPWGSLPELMAVHRDAWAWAAALAPGAEAAAPGA